MHIASEVLKLIIDRSVWVCFPEIIHLVFKTSSNKKTLKRSLNENHIFTRRLCMCVFVSNSISLKAASLN